MNKIDELAQQYGQSDGLELAKDYMFDGIAPAICMNPDCDYTTEYEPDQRAGWCEACETNSVQSILVLLGVI